MSGVLLQKLIIDLTQADTDQKHLLVITYTNPQIPDRTKSLLGPSRGNDFVVAIADTANILARAGATVIGIPCNTSHAKYAEIQSAVPVPIINMVEKTIEVLEKENVGKVGLLATDGTIRTSVYSKTSHNISWILPNKEDQENIMQLIYGIKSGLPFNKKIILNVCENLVSRGADRIVLGCTEISLLYTTISAYFSTTDSLRTLAQSLVSYTAPTTQVLPPPSSVHEIYYKRANQRVLEKR